MSISGTISEYERHQTFTYDNVGRLATATGWADITWSRRFTYDRWGNRTKTEEQSSKSWCTKQVMDFKVGPGGEPLTNQATSVENYTDCSFDKASPGLYDAAGNTKSYGTRNGWISHIYDGESRLARFQQQDGESLWQYSYDAANRRVKKVAEGAATHYVWEGGQVIAEHNGVTGAAISEYVFAGSRMVAGEQSGVLWRYYHQDRLSTRMSTAGNGVIVGTQDHMPFGEDATSTNSHEQEKHRFTSYERDSESNTDYAVNRQYGTATGRFLQPDRIGGSIGSPQSLNRYSYSLNDPPNLADPLGLNPYVWDASKRGPGVYLDGFELMPEMWALAFGLVAMGAADILPDGAVRNRRGDGWAIPYTDEEGLHYEDITWLVEMNAVLVSMLIGPKRTLVPCPPSGRELANNQKVKQAMNRAWQDSKAGTAASHEEGGFIFWKPGTNAIDVVRASRGAAHDIDLMHAPE